VATQGYGLDVTGLHVSYGRVRALQGVDLRVDPGKVIVLLGANGAGKTTLLKAISNLVPAQRGSISLWGERTLSRPAHEITALGVAHVPEGRGVFGQLTVRENLLMGAYLVAAGERAERYEEVTRLFPRLKERWNQRAGNLSGGEQQMLALARALVLRPRLLLLDEPSLGLAPLLARDAFQAIKDINRRGVSVLLVEQNAHLALSIADYAYVLRNGRMEAEGTPGEVRSVDAVRRAYLGVG
jgi:branched-chain amino acid transport system ATP-binding protein